MIIKVKDGQSVVLSKYADTETFVWPCRCHGKECQLYVTISTDEWKFMEIMGRVYYGNIFKRICRALRHIFIDGFSEEVSFSYDWSDDGVEDRQPTEIRDLANWILENIK